MVTMLSIVLLIVLCAATLRERERRRRAKILLCCGAGERPLVDPNDMSSSQRGGEVEVMEAPRNTAMPVCSSELRAPRSTRNPALLRARAANAARKLAAPFSRRLSASARNAPVPPRVGPSLYEPQAVTAVASPPAKKQQQTKLLEGQTAQPEEFSAI